MFDLSWGGGGGGYKTNGGWIYGFVLGVFTTKIVMSRVGCLICPGGCVRRMVEMVSRVDIWVCLGGVFTTEKVMSRVGCLICPGGGVRRMVEMVDM